MKDTIYIDVEDDITAIIGKVKSANNRIVALIPPKRIGVLQSAVNLRLLARAAKQNDKHLVLISGNSALTALAASAGIPSARNLQSKPELAAVPESSEDHEEDVINGADLPVGDIARTEEGQEEVAPVAPAIDSAIRANAAEEASVSPLPRPPKAKAAGIKVPSFNTFRRRLVLGAGGLVALIVFLVWAIMFAPNATIAITARTIESSANPKVVLATSAATNAAAGTVKAVQQEIKSEASLSFDATGEKEVGEKASGQIILRNCYEDSVTVDAGTGVSANGNTYITKAKVTIAAGQGNFGGCTNPGVSIPVTVEAQEIGEGYNTDEASFCVAGFACSGPRWLRAAVSSEIDGGSKRKVKIVTKEDLEKATDQLAGQSNVDIKNQLLSKFGEGSVPIDATFKVDKGEVSSVPAIDTEAADGTAKLTGSLVYTMTGVEKAEINHFLDAYFANQIKDDNQRVYENGAEKTTFVDVNAADNGFTATMTATAKFGPKIDDNAVKNQAAGKKFGEVQSAIEGISGVESVDVAFSPFWVKTVPKDQNRITIEFNLDESK